MCPAPTGYLTRELEGGADNLCGPVRSPRVLYDTFQEDEGGNVFVGPQALLTIA